MAMEPASIQNRPVHIPIGNAFRKAEVAVQAGCVKVKVRLRDPLHSELTVRESSPSDNYVAHVCSAQCQYLSLESSTANLVAMIARCKGSSFAHFFLHGVTSLVDTCGRHSFMTDSHLFLNRSMHLDVGFRGHRRACSE